MILGGNSSLWVQPWMDNKNTFWPFRYSIGPYWLPFGTQNNLTLMAREQIEWGQCACEEWSPMRESHLCWDARESVNLLSAVQNHSRWMFNCSCRTQKLYIQEVETRQRDALLALRLQILEDFDRRFNTQSQHIGPWKDNSCQQLMGLPGIPFLFSPLLSFPFLSFCALVGMIKKKKYLTSTRPRSDSQVLALSTSSALLIISSGFRLHSFMCVTVPFMFIIKLMVLCRSCNANWYYKSFTA